MKSLPSVVKAACNLKETGSHCKRLGRGESTQIYGIPCCVNRLRRAGSGWKWGGLRKLLHEATRTAEK